MGNTQVTIYSMKRQSRPKYTSATEMTMDPSRSPEEALWALTRGEGGEGRECEGGRVLFTA